MSAEAGREAFDPMLGGWVALHFVPRYPRMIGERVAAAEATIAVAAGRAAWSGGSES